MSIKLERQHRLTPVSLFRAIGAEESRQFAATVLRYNVVDEYGTEFSPECFLESLQRRMPRIVWGHDWTDPIGRWTKWENVIDDDGVRLDLVGEFDDFAAVPRARQAYAQLKSGTIDQFSVGFMPEEARIVVHDGEEVVQFTRGRLDEASLVLVGAVPGTALLSVRHPAIQTRNDATVAKDFAATLLLDLHQGKIDLADALQAVKSQQAVPEKPAVDDAVGAADPPSSEVSDETAPPAAATGTEAPEPEPEPDPEPEPEPAVELDFAEFSDVDAILTSF